MPTSNPRVNVTLDPKVNDQINKIADQESKSVSRLIQDLIIEALKMREDFYLSDLAEHRDSVNQKTISHKDAWKE